MRRPSERRVPLASPARERRRSRPGLASSGRSARAFGDISRRLDGRWRSRPSPVRAAALLAILAAILALDGLTTTTALAIQRIEVSPLQWTSRDEVVRLLGAEPGGNAFSLATTGLAARIEALPAVAAAHVEVVLPDTLIVTVTERAPILAWRIAAVTYLVDRDGRLFAIAGSPPGGVAPSAGATSPSAAAALPSAGVASASAGVASPSGAAASPSQEALPMVLDQRAGSPAILGLGATLDATDLDAATRLASLTPEDIGSRAPGLLVRITDGDGFVLTTNPGSWSAIFGPYSPILRTPDLIPGQVRLLRSLLAGREDQVQRVVLADAGNGTYVPLPTNR
jgi:cell division protein FtsQ